MIDNDDWGSEPPTEPAIIVSMIREAQDVDTIPVDPAEVLRDIGSDRWAKQVQAVQSAYEKGGKDAAAPFKKKLPGILFSGNFRKRNANDLITHSGLICVDLDHLDNQVDAIKEQVCANPHTLAAFRSPTGSGLKVVLRCDPSKPHIESFKAAEQFMLEQFGLEIDKACKDVNRICFVSHDPEIFIADSAEQIPYPPKPAQYKPAQYTNGTGDSPGDAYNLRGDWQSVLLAHGWSKVGSNGWRRPGKTEGISATWDKVAEFPQTFYVFSSSTEFEVGKVYHPWHIYALLECGGDFTRAARELGNKGYGKRLEPQRPLDRIIQDSAKPAKSAPDLKGRKPFSFRVPADDDSSILIGNRYLNRGDGAVLSSTSGMGKSSMTLQMATEYALNLGPFGMRGNGALRSLVIQSEDSDGDVAEVMLSLQHRLELTAEQMATVDDRVMIVTDRVNRGAAFIVSLKKLIDLHKPDLVWINPLQAFIDGDVTDSQDLGRFLRERLNGLNEPPSFAYILVHHTTKPATGKDKATRLWHEVMYDMAGGAEIINWARAIMSLRAAETEGDFNLVLAKRGRRAGVTRMVEQGAGEREEPVTIIPLRHAQGKIEVPGVRRPISLIYWESREPDAAKPEGQRGSGGRKAQYEFEDYSKVFPSKASDGMPLDELHRALIKQKPILKTTLHNVLKRWIEPGWIEVITKPGNPTSRYRLSI